MRGLSIYRILKDRISFVLICIFSVLAIIPVISLVLKFLWEGIGLLSFELFFQTIPNSMEAMLSAAEGESVSGGIINGILGSFYMVFIGIALAVPLGVVSGIFISDNDNRKFGTLMNYIINILQGVPTIIIGLIVYLWIVRTSHGYSAFAGGVALALVMLPVIVKRTASSFENLPEGLKESGYALGASYTKLTFSILLPSVNRELISTILMSISKGIGETAPLLFTALGASEINWHINQPISSLSMLLWEFFYNPYMKSFMWAGALVLLLLIFLFNAAAKYMLRLQH